MRCKGLKSLAIQPVHRPLRERLGLQRAIERERGLVPVEHVPLKPCVAPRDRQLRKRGEKQLAEALAATLRQHEEVFEPEAVATGPRGVRDEVEGKPHHMLIFRRHVRVDAPLGTKERSLEISLRGDDTLTCALILGKRADQRMEGRDIGRKRCADLRVSHGPHGGMLARRIGLR